MQRLVILILGILALGLLTFWCARSHGPAIEEDLASRASSALAEAPGSGLVTVTAQGRDLTLEGAVPQVPGLRETLLELAHVEGVRVVSDGMEERSGPRFSVRRSEDAWGVISMLPESLREEAEQKAALWLGPEVAEEWVTYSAPGGLDTPPWKVFLAALPHLPGIERADFVATPQQATLRGFVPEARSLERVHRALTHAAGDTLALEILVTTLLETGDLKLEAVDRGDGLVLTGVVPEGGLRGRIVQEAGRLGAVRDAVVESRMVEWEEAPEGFGDGFLAALPALEGLGNARLVETMSRLELTGLSDDPRRGPDLRKELSSRLPDYALKVEVVEELGIAPCQQRLDELLAAEKIFFASGSHAVEPGSRALLRSLASTLRRCPGSALRVAGHTDGDGDEAMNLALSRRRAATVVSELMSLGVEPSRLASEGFGEARPLADNAIDAGKAVNRRIEFLLQGGL